MMIEVLKSKIHCATVTEANLNYMGSITIDEDLMDAANIASLLALPLSSNSVTYQGTPPVMLYNANKSSGV